MRALAGLAIVAAALVLSPMAASGHERLTHAAVGAVAGAVVAGPVGFVGGGLIGYVAGPRIGCDLGIERCHRHRRYRHRHNAPEAVPRSSDQNYYGRSAPAEVGTRPDHGNY